MPSLNQEVVQTDFEMEIQARIDAERARLRAEAGLAACANTQNRWNAPSPLQNAIG